ncbi:MAG: SDR family oxidoreductase [Bacteroidetes Order II. Incertae sedis bacterium]|jgi:short-subunit dehydrogenase|nr:SDR family oxidoreductase [Bacteroidetes Order II. bacterium]MDG1755673.1 SDR family NAD(P)-dependent oxidoreductase [Rhodothermales bacterium]HAY37811.1 NAD-binding protein [Bacteroidota bacterium]MBT4053106.1 SDR family oxidoreductase [Bacteroidetes Order II. bacterium]MBT4601662.1 SDR family oxidoreductase [Bacteroidetes Order II. bacterium]
MDLQQKIVVVTGASAGLGADFSETLVERGAKVYGLARRQDRLDRLAERIGSGFTGLTCDVADEHAVSRAFETILEREGRIDVLVNNAGLGRMGAADELSIEDWDIQMNVNLRGVFLCTKAALPAMKAQNANGGFGGHIVNISSVAGLMGNPNISAYNVTKFGLKGYSDALFKEVRNDGIKVTCLFPGSIQTEFFDEAGMSISPNPMTPAQMSSTLVHVLETPDNYLISEIVMRPLRPRG